MKNPSVLVVDDSKDHAKMYHDYLTRRGVLVTRAHRASEALTMDWGQFDVVLADVMMPFIDGDRMVEIAHAEFSGDKFPSVIFLSAVDEQSLLRMATWPISKLCHAKFWSKVGRLSTLMDLVMSCVSYPEMVQT